jgi:hypothetical protein
MRNIREKGSVARLFQQSPTVSVTAVPRGRRDMGFVELLIAMTVTTCFSLSRRLGGKGISEPGKSLDE